MMHAGNPSPDTWYIPPSGLSDSTYAFACAGGSLNFWNDPEEDIYTLRDGRPVEAP